MCLTIRTSGMVGGGGARGGHRFQYQYEIFSFNAKHAIHRPFPHFLWTSIAHHQCDNFVMLSTDNLYVIIKCVLNNYNVWNDVCCCFMKFVIDWVSTFNCPPWRHKSIYIINWNTDINIICLLLKNIVYSLIQQSTPWQV